MGQAQRMMEEQDDLLATAWEICIRADAISQCKVCDDFVTQSLSPFIAYMMGNTLFTAQDPLVAEFRTRTQMTDAIQQAYNDSQEHCHCHHSWHAD